MESTTAENESETHSADKVKKGECNNGDVESGAVETRMPSASAPSKEDFEYVIDGLSQWLNNKPNESETFFKSKSDSNTILVGYAFVLCMVNTIRIHDDLQQNGDERILNVGTADVRASTILHYVLPCQSKEELPCCLEI